jgi:uncharacterized protein (DUF433 family)
MTDFTRITQNPAVMGGKPCIRGLRVTVGMIVGQIAARRTIDDLLAEYPYLQREDILEALRYRAEKSSELYPPSCLALRRASASFFVPKAWIAGTSPAMTLRE